MFSQKRDQTREVFFRAWRRFRDGAPLEGVERVIVDVAVAHPEYHALLDDAERHLDRDYSPEMGQTNPFLHMGMHIAIEEQLSVDRPHGIATRYQQLLRKTGDRHAAQHLMMDCLGETLWQAQRAGIPPDDQAYLACLDRFTA